MIAFVFNICLKFLMIAPFTLTANAADSLISTLPFVDETTLLPAIAIQHDTNELLMQAWINRTALLETLTTGRVCYYSRSRQGLWRKGESSGHTQWLHSLRTDCDMDCIMLLVNQVGAACHTYRHNCFFHEATTSGEWNIISDPMN
jgi:phosphoribosyl-AMP cyclohydrolase